MDKSVYVAMSGAMQNMTAMAVHANNIANVATTGFRADLAHVTSVSMQSAGVTTRAYPVLQSSATDMQPGTLAETGRSLDVAINGEGWIAVQALDGTEAYTRAGELKLDTSGQLLTGNGLPVLGNGAPISLPPAQSVHIGVDGTISIRPLGAAAQELAEIDRIKLVKAERGELVKGADGLMHPTADEPLLPDATVRLESGFLESSNVNAVSALTDLIALSRQFEIQVKAMKAAESNGQASARLLQFN